MKILFDEITVSSKTKNIDIFDGEKDVIINKKDFDRVKTIEGAIPISEKCKDLNTLKIKGKGISYNVSFTEDQQNKVTKVIIEVPSMPFSELQTYNFDPNKKYRVHINQDCMNNAGIFNWDLSKFLNSKTNIVEALIDGNVTKINSNAFNECRSLTSVTIPDGITSIGEGAFFCCISLISITIPNSVTEIDSYAFSNCQRLPSINIPNSITSIGEQAFYQCRSLTSITYTGTKEQWNAIPNLVNVEIPWGCKIHCTDGDI